MRRVLLLLPLVAGCPELIEAETASSNSLGTTSSSDSDTSGTTIGSSSTNSSSGTTSSTNTTGATMTSSVSSTTTTSATTGGTTTATCDSPCKPGEAPGGLSCTQEYGFDFSEVPQWYCSGGCSPLGEPVGGMSCDQPDADLFCALLTGNPDAKAEKWAVNAVIDAPGFCCLDLFPELSLGPLADYGVDELCYMGESMIGTHANGSAILAEDITCVVP